MPASLTVRKYESSEWPLYRDLRLRALSQSPDAFGSTLAAEQGRSADDWAARLAAGSTSGLDLPLLAQANGHGAGLAWAQVDASNPSVLNLYQMWVAPEYRGQGLGRMLLRAAIDWARARHAHAMHLGARRGDTPAMRLYTREGFRPLCHGEPLRPGSSPLFQDMWLPLYEGGA
jgi:GNAT superfamily N-acetyltransferase